MNTDSNPINEHNFDFRALLYYHLIVSGDYEISTVAEKMKISADTLYRYCEDKLSFPIERLPDLINATGNLKFLTYFASKCGYALVPKIRDRKLADAMIAAANLLLAAAKEGK